MPLWVTPAGEPFADACQAAAADGRDWRPECLAAISSCDQLEEAYRTPRDRPCPAVAP